jgi:hypothetical protein
MAESINIVCHVKMKGKNGLNKAYPYRNQAQVQYINLAWINEKGKRMWHKVYKENKTVGSCRRPPFWSNNENELCPNYIFPLQYNNNLHTINIRDRDTWNKNSVHSITSQSRQLLKAPEYGTVSTTRTKWKCARVTRINKSVIYAYIQTILSPMPYTLFVTIRCWFWSCDFISPITDKTIYTSNTVSVL